MARHGTAWHFQAFRVEKALRGARPTVIFRLVHRRLAHGRQGPFGLAPRGSAPRGSGGGQEMAVAA